MIAKVPAVKATRVRKRRVREPVEVKLSFKVRFGDAPDEAVTVIDDRAIPMVNSVFENRDRILRTFTMLLLRASLAQPKVMREVFPALKFLRKLRKSS